MVRSITIGILAGAASVSSSAQTAAPNAAPCGGAEYRQLDFWIGEWTVSDTAKGSHVGTSRIEPVMGGCSIKESYSAPDAPGGAYAGTSYSSFDRNDGKWHQFYVDVNGNANWFVGGLHGTDVVLIATVRGGALQRMTYRRHADGSVEQIGVISTDNGRSWQPGYDYTYRKK